MKAKIDRKEILKRLSVKSDRTRTTLYISKSLYEDFKKACDEVPPSQVIEELMRQFVGSVGSKR